MTNARALATAVNSSAGVSPAALTRLFIRRGRGTALQGGAAGRRAAGGGAGSGGDGVRVAVGRQRAARAQVHDEREDLGDRGEQLGGDLLADLDALVHRAGQRDVLDERDVVLPRQLADA